MRDPEKRKVSEKRYHDSEKGKIATKKQQSRLDKLVTCYHCKERQVTELQAMTEGRWPRNWIWVCGECTDASKQTFATGYDYD